MTVSEDGTLVCSDPGVGILAPGWHAEGPPPLEPRPCKGVCCNPVVLDTDARPFFECMPCETTAAECRDGLGLDSKD